MFKLDCPSESVFSREPIMCPERLFGREKELDRLRGYLTSSSPQSVNLVGEPRIGKTSILNQMMNWDIFLNANTGFRLASLSLGKLPEINSRVFWEAMYRALETDEQAATKDETALTYNAEYFFECCAGMLESRDKEQRRTVLVVDDGDLMYPSLQRSDFIKLRAFEMKFARSCVFVVASTDSLLALWDDYFPTVPDQHRTRPFGATFQRLVVGNLESDAAEDLVWQAAEEANIAVTREDVQVIIRECGRHPSLLKIGCSYLLGLAPGSNAGFSEIIKYELRGSIRLDAFTQWLCRRLRERQGHRSPEAVEALVALARGEQIEDDSLLILLPHLREIGLVESYSEKEGRHWRIFADAFAYWLRKASKVLPGEEQPYSADVSLSYDPTSSELRIGTHTSRLTPVENRLLAYMYEKSGRTCTLEELRDEIWGEDKSLAVVEKTINRLRRKVEPDTSRPRYLKSVRGNGYALYARPQG